MLPCCLVPDTRTKLKVDCSVMSSFNCKNLTKVEIPSAKLWKGTTDNGERLRRTRAKVKQ